MKNLTAIFVLLFLTGCAGMTTKEKWWLAGGIIVTGYAMSRSEAPPVQAGPQDKQCPFSASSKELPTKFC